MLKQLNFFYSQPSTLPRDAPTKFYLSTSFGLSSMISSVAHTRSLIPYLITKIGNRKLKVVESWLTFSETGSDTFRVILIYMERSKNLKKNIS